MGVQPQLPGQLPDEALLALEDRTGVAGEEPGQLLAVTVLMSSCSNSFLTSLAVTCAELQGG